MQLSVANPAQTRIQAVTANKVPTKLSHDHVIMCENLWWKTCGHMYVNVCVCECGERVGATYVEVGIGWWEGGGQNT